MPTLQAQTALHETNAQLNQARASHKELTSRLEAEVEAVQVCTHEPCESASSRTLEEMAQLMALQSALPALTATLITSMASNPGAVNSARQKKNKQQIEGLHRGSLLWNVS